MNQMEISMKKIFIFTIIIICTIPAFADFSKFAEAYKNRKFLLAEKYIQQSYNKNPKDDKILFWYGYTLYENERYDRALEILLRVSPDYQSVQTQNKIGQIYLVKKQIKNAYDAFSRATKYEESNPSYKNYSFAVMLNIINDSLTPEKYANDFITAEKRYEKFIKKHSYFKAYYTQYLFAKVFYKIAVSYGDDPEALTFYKKSILRIDKGLGIYTKYINRNDVKICMNASEYWINNKTKIDSSEVHNISFISIKNFNGKYRDKQKSKTGRLIDGELFVLKEKNSRSCEEICKSSFEVMKQLVFFYSKGKLLLKGQFSDTGVSVTQIRVGLWESANNSRGRPINSIVTYAPVMDSLSPYPYTYFEKTINNTDTYFIIYPFNKAIGIGGPTRVPIVPYTLKSPLKGMVQIADNGRIMTPEFFMHEFFHNVEARYRKIIPSYKFISHVYKDGYKSKWPKWYKGEGELTYYHEVFKRYIDRAGYEVLDFNSDKSIMNQKQIEKVKELYSSYSSLKIKKAAELKIKADSLYRTNRSGKKESIEMYKAIFKIYPFMTDVNDILRNEYITRKNYKVALECEKRSYEVDQYNPGRLHWLAYLYEKCGKMNDAIIIYGEKYKLDFDPQSLYNQGRLSAKIKDIENAIKYYSLFIEKGRDNYLKQYSVNNLVYQYTYNEKFKDYKKAVILAEKYFSIIIDRKLKASIAFNTAVSFSNLGEKEKAVNWLKVAEKNGYNNRRNLDYYYKLNR